MSESQVYLVTGASKGLGRSICYILASNGFTVIGIARSSIELSSLENHLKNINPKSATFACDLSSEN
ncbi:MAG: SDR family NAD(P)-dependent oxidoreductase, partial [Candidatus Poseidoniaceae archaeon]